MPKMKLAAVPLLALAVVGCGASSSTTSSSTASTHSNPAATSPGLSAAGTTSSAAATSPYGQPSTPAASSAATTAIITTKHAAKLGTVLALGPKKLTVYLFDADKSGASTCIGACARVWPPVIGTPKAAGGAMSSDLGTVTRPDGSKQITYKGHPLYLFAKDKDDGDAYGEGLKSFGAGWYALSPSGHKIDLS